jgi:hypothetical protein
MNSSREIVRAVKLTHLIGSLLCVGHSVKEDLNPSVLKVRTQFGPVGVFCSHDNDALGSTKAGNIFST